MLLHFNHSGKKYIAPTLICSGANPGSEFEPAVLCGFLSRCSGFLLLSKDMQVRLNRDSKLPKGVNVSVNACLSVCVSPVTDW